MIEILLLAALGWLCGRSFRSPNIPSYKFESDAEARFVMKYVPKFELEHYIAYDVHPDLAPVYIFILKILAVLFILLPMIVVGSILWLDFLIVLIVVDLMTFNQHRWLSVTWWNEEWNRDYKGRRKYPYSLDDTQDIQE